jgi:hypothetical protein
VEPGYQQERATGWCPRSAAWALQRADLDALRKLLAATKGLTRGVREISIFQYSTAMTKRTRSGYVVMALEKQPKKDGIESHPKIEETIRKQNTLSCLA